MSSTDLIEPEKISPEGLKIAEAYLANGSSIVKTAEALDMRAADIEMMLKKNEVSSFINRVYYESGFRNRDKIASVMDTIIAAKLEEMDDTGLGSEKDIVDIMKITHDMKMQEIKMEIALMEARKKAEPASQTNIQINTGYDALIQKLGGGS